MATPTNTFISYDAIGNREDLTDDIYLIDPIDTPLMSMAERSRSRAVLHEWQTQSLAAAAANANLEGDDPSTNATTATTRLSNTCQISQKTARVSGTQEAIDHAGRASEMDYQMSLKAAELKRDMETVILRAQAEAAGDTTNARTLGAMLSWITTNVSLGTGGSAAGTSLIGNTVRTDGTQRAFTEDLLQDVLQLCWENGGDPDCIMLGAFNKRTFSTFTGNATRFKGAEDRKLMAGIDIYDSDWGELKVVPNRFQRARDGWVIQKNMVSVPYLRPFKLRDLAKTGDSERKQLLAEYTLEVKNEVAHGLVADLTTS